MYTYVCIHTRVFLTKSSYYISEITVYRSIIAQNTFSKINWQFGFKISQTHAPFIDLLLLQSAATIFTTKISQIQNNLKNLQYLSGV